MTEEENKEVGFRDLLHGIKQENNDEPRTENHYAGFWMRFWAYLVDVIIIFSINGFLLSPIILFNDGLDVVISYWTLTGILGATLFYLYFVFMTKMLGQTIGKMIFGLRVIRYDSQPLKWSDLLFREVIARFVYKVFFFFNILYLVIAFSPEKQGLHDMIGNTRVIHER